MIWLLQKIKSNQRLAKHIGIESDATTKLKMSPSIVLVVESSYENGLVQLFGVGEE
jgi:hypothetical protein